MSAKKTALVISAHSADFVWRAGGAIALHQAKGYEVTVAEDLSSAHAKTLSEALKDVLGKEPKIEVKVDPAILGGLIVKVGSRMIDTSLRTKLNSIRTAMKEVG